MHSPLGTLLKIEKDTDTTKYLIPPTATLSRFVYQSETVRGSKVPVSGYVLWPSSPRSQPDGYPVIAWAHGTSGFDANAAPSHHKNLWQQFLAPYQIALQGYVVATTDYAGLGVQKHPSGQPIVHEYLASPSQAKDRAALTSVPGYLGAVAVSPYLNLLEEQNESSRVLAVAMYPGLASVFPEFSPGDLHTADVALLSGVEFLKQNWKENTHFLHYQALTSNGGKAINGPLLVTHCKSDPALSVAIVENAVERTADLFPSFQIEYASLPNVTHVAALAASQRLWMNWIGDRFAGRAVEATCHSHRLACARPDSSRQSDQNRYLESATQPYHAPGP
ncbi:MAG: hypothetical protein ALECFALPRED_000026 [Alectoria fallacina]|uniref:Uncharacterized protein n=1 Tax=Alectoria fallacina TaxID=1903189 RepID=A0A8H3ECB6_9LECA|nr:MAG: hypothetical protein ALECFALPRED_000026 [Alectoria fallacina]